MQEALAKWPALLARNPDIRLHGIGRLQSNKAAEAVKLFDIIHSLDRGSLLEALVKEADKAERFPAVYVQVNIGEEEQKGGCPIAEVGASSRGGARIATAARRVDGDSAARARSLHLISRCSPSLPRRHDVTGLSMGMSGDFQAAVMLGATAVRVGTALFED